MPRFYFHLSAPDQDFRDSIGCDVNDLSAAHSRAVQLADRVMMFSAFANRDVEFRRWTVKVADDRQRPVMTVIFPADFVLEKCNRRPVSGARTLLARLDETLNPLGGARWTSVLVAVSPITTKPPTYRDRSDVSEADIVHDLNV